MNNKPLGFISQKYESGNAGPGTISDIPGDGGGKAYGVFQLDSNFRHVKLYVTQSEYKDIFNGLVIGSEEFDAKWKTIAETDGTRFEESQRLYVTRRYYNTAIAYAGQTGFDVTSRAIQETIFSIAVQHGGYRTILKAARRMMPSDTESQVHAIYEARRNYVQSLQSLSDPVKVALLNRYQDEEQDVLSLL